jgi:predicted nucleic acid-binding Zn finger protein
LTSEFSTRLEDAKKLVEEKSVKKYIITYSSTQKVERWVVVGNTREYLIMVDPYWCRCYDFQHSVLNNRVPQCKHNLAVQIALREKLFETYYLDKEEYDFIRSEFLLS